MSTDDERARDEAMAEERSSREPEEEVQEETMAERRPSREFEFRYGDVEDERRPSRESEIRFGDIGEEDVEDEPVDQTGAGDMPGDRKPKQLLSDEDLEKAARADDARIQVRNTGEIRFGAVGEERTIERKRRLEPLELDLPTLTKHLDTAETGTGISSHDELRLCRKYEEKIESLEQRKWRELPADVDPHKLAKTGWGVVFALGEDPAIPAQLRPLLRRREDQAANLYRKLTYHPSESASVFLWNRHGEIPGVFDPERLPYYILIVGSPEKIPFEFQYQLATSHAVGRIAFDDVEDYGRYARAVVKTERKGSSLSRKATLFSVERGDWVTDLLARHLVAPLREDWNHLADDWKLETLCRSKASSSNLRQCLDSEAAPGIILASCHGESFAAGDARQKRYQGALLCQQDDDRFSADDVSESSRLDGQVIFLFCCYGAGTPVRSNFPHAAKKGEPEILAEQPFVARLPQELLSRGALACIGHVDRGWTTSFAWAFGDKEIPAVLSLKDTILQLLRQGHRLGHAMRSLVRRYTAIAAALTLEIERREHGGDEADDEQARQRREFEWTALNDARNFIVLGDPAVYVLGRPREHTQQNRSRP